jgi:hypothetical protein
MDDSMKSNEPLVKQQSINSPGRRHVDQASDNLTNRGGNEVNRLEMNKTIEN